jgi:hypothetical protein
MPAGKNRAFLDSRHILPVLPFFLAGGILILVSEGLSSDHETTGHLILDVAKEFGIALVIAAVVFLAFEAAAKRNHDKSILAYLYGLDTGAPYFRVIEDYIIRCPFYRTETDITYSFKERHGETYLIEYITEFRVKNISQVTQQYAVHGAVGTKSIYVKDLGEWELGVVDIEFPERRDLWSLKVTQTPNSHSPDIKEFRSQPIVLPSNHDLKVRIVQQIAKHDHDSDVWQAAIPSDGLKLRIEWKEEWDLQLGHEAIHPNEQFLDITPGNADGLCWRTLVLNQPFLERHGIHFFWATK